MPILFEMFGLYTIIIHIRDDKTHCKQCAHTSFHSNQAKYALDLIEIKRPETYKMGLLFFCFLCIIIMADISDSSIT